MPLSAGDRLGPYEILSAIGAGGMGQVWKARDTRLHRDVAIKTSQGEFSYRFQREAHAIAAMNHPNIWQLYDVGDDYLVMELVDGVPLKGPLPVDKAILYAGQILDALDAAHRKGIMHRDPKPGNILVTKQGIKLLVFGLAKRAAPVTASEETVTDGLTGTGQIVGTLQYMSPEQLRGQEVDCRSDLFAFWCLFYELLNGKRAFPASDAAGIIGAILHSEPPPLETMEALQKVVRHCLAKDPDERFQSARDLKTALLWAAGQTDGVAPAAARSKELWWVSAALVPSIVFGWLWYSKSIPEAPLVRFEVPIPGESWVRAHRLDLSPDGQQLAFIAANASGKRQIFLRRMDELESKPLRSTEGAQTMFWSGDSRALAFSDGGPLRRVDIDGKNAATLGPFDAFSGGAWSRNGVILDRPSPIGGLQQVSAEGGAARPATVLNTGAGEISHLFPSFLPDGQHFVYQSVTAAGRRAIEFGSLASSECKRLIEESNPMVHVSAPDGKMYLAFQRENSLMVQPFDGKRGALTGAPVAIVDTLGQMTENIPFSFSNTGLLVYSSFTTLSRRLIWYDRTGKQIGEVPSNGTELAPALSPDESRLAVVRGDGTAPRDVWVADLARNGWMRVSFGGEGAINPVWSPDGKRIAYTVGGSSGSSILEKDATGVGEAREIGKASPWPQHWSPDGRQILYVDYAARALMAMPVTGDPKPIVIAKPMASYYPASYSPDGKYILYTSAESGRQEVYVMAVPPAQGKWLVSTDCGGMSAWRRDGKEIFFIGHDLKMMAVDVRFSPAFEVGTPHPLFQTNVTGLMDGRNHYAVSRDGQRFLISSPARTESAGVIKVVMNWTALLGKGR